MNSKFSYVNNYLYSSQPTQLPPPINSTHCSVFNIVKTDNIEESLKKLKLSDGQLQNDEEIGCNAFKMDIGPDQYISYHRDRTQSDATKFDFIFSYCYYCLEYYIFAFVSFFFIIFYNEVSRSLNSLLNLLG